MKKRFLAIAFVLIFALLPLAAMARDAVPSSHGVYVDGIAVDVRAFNIGGRNYFMLRDVAYILRDTSAQFDVEFDDRGRLLLERGDRYEGTLVGIDMSAATARESRADVIVSGIPVNFAAYNIHGRTFFQLRELGDALGFTIGWNPDTNTILITTPPNHPEPPAPGPEPIPAPQPSPEPSPEPTPAPTPTPPPAATGDFTPITAAEWVSNVGMGWNLGNHLDARVEVRGRTVEQMETAWINTRVTPQLINSVYGAGFNAIRIPITWQKAIDDDFNIRADWMARVRQIVDYAVANDMYIMINTHHDDEIFRLHDRYMADSRRAVERLWTQIANEFESYNERLVFQGFNEPRTRYSPREWQGGTPEERANLNILNQLFVDTVRATGGNNAERVLIVPTYAGSASAPAVSGLVVPTDSVPDRIIVSIHSYSPWLFALRIGPDSTDRWDPNNSADTSPIRTYIDRAYNTFVSNGIPVVFSEAGAVNRGNLQARVAWTEFWWGHAHSRGIPTFWWDNNYPGVTPDCGGPSGETFGIIDRRTGAITHQEIIDAMLRATAR